MFDQSTPGLLVANEMNPDCFKVAAHSSLRSSHTVAAFNGLRTDGINKIHEIPMKPIEPQFGDSFGKPDSMSNASSERLKLRSYQSLKSLNSATGK